MKLVIVESPTKAKTIEKYLGSEYKAISSYGHIRELEPKNGSVDVDNFSMKYQWIARNKKHIAKIIEYAKKSEIVYLASDPDREGEAIAYSLLELLKSKRAAKVANIKRITFNEINKAKINQSIKEAREVDMNLVNAQQSRVALDYLVGFNLSPVLWRKLPGSKSAGRVQSVALRLINDRELDIKSFVPKEFWSIDALVKSSVDFKVPMVEFEGKKINKEFPASKEEAGEVVDKVMDDGKIKVVSIKSADKKQRPLPPFTTSLMQQEASRKLGFSSSRTMKIAQELYEGIKIKAGREGLITYMRTDGMSISAEAIKAIRTEIESSFGDEYLPSKPHYYKTKIKNAQEAHEAIRVTQITYRPEEIKQYLSSDQYRLYTLIWKRTIACQMSVAIKTTDSIIFSNVNVDSKYSISSTKIKFLGFLKAYNVSEDSETNVLPDVKEGDVFTLNKCQPVQHFTKPLPRFNEASLIKTMEELGIGRPSTYSSIISILQERDYVSIDNKQFVVQSLGMVVTTFLKNFFANYVAYDFTAKLEEDLDHISDGSLNKIAFLRQFWQNFNSAVESSKGLDVVKVSQLVAEQLKPFFMIGSMLKCSKCSSDNNFAVGKYGPYVSCSNEECGCRVSIGKYNADGEPQEDLHVEEDGKSFVLKNGPYGHYVVVTEADGSQRNCAIPKSVKNVEKSDLIKYGSLPIDLGKHPDDGKKITANIGRFGPYVSYNSMFFSLKKVSVFDVDHAKALEIIAQDIDKKAPKVTYKHPKSKSNITVGKGRYGVYVLYKKKYYNLKNVSNPSEVTKEMAVEAIDNAKK